MSRFLAGRLTRPASLAADSRRLLIALFTTAVLLYWLSLYLYVPTLPTYVESKSEQLAMVGVVLAQYGLWQAVVRLPLGIAADWLGWHKPLIIIGFALSGLGALAMGLAEGVGELALGRAITGLAAATWVPLVVVFSSFFPLHEAVRATTMLTFVSSAARVLATAVTGSLNQHAGYGLAFFLAAGAALLAILFVLPVRAPRRARRRPSFSGIGRLISRRDVLLPSLLAAVAQYVSWAATFSFIPILARELGASDVTLSLLLSLNLALVVVGNLATTTIVNRIGTRWLVFLSFLLSAAGLGLAATSHSLAMVFAAQLWLGVSQGVGYPLLMGLSIQFVNDDSRATAMGLHQAVYAIGMFTGPWLSGILADAMGIQSMFGLTALGCLVLGLLPIYWLTEGN